MSTLERLERANPVADADRLLSAPGAMDDFVLAVMERSGIVQTAEDRAPIEVPRETETGPPHQGRRRRLIPVLVGATVVIAAIVVAVVLLSGDDQPDVTNEAPVTTTVASRPEGAASLIGATGRITDGLASSRPDAIHFDEDGTFQVVQDGETIDHGSYQTEGDLITFISEPPEPVWQIKDCPGDSCFIDVVYNCEGIAGQYQVIFQETASFTLEVVNDTCAPRTLVARGLQMELLTG